MIVRMLYDLGRGFGRGTEIGFIEFIYHQVLSQLLYKPINLDYKESWT